MLLSDFEITKDKIKTFRLGKYDKNKNRPIKVLLNSPEDAKNVLKNKKTIKVPSIIIFNDQTKMQREYYNDVKQKLNNLILSGDTSKTIKFINDKPTIVIKSPVQNSKN